ncbi:MAG: sugar transferase [Pseudomonadota bacterium]
MRIAISGASGFIGQHLVTHLAAQGHDLILLGRDNAKLIALFPDYDARGYYDLEQTFRGVDVILHLAAALPTADLTEEEFAGANVALTRNMVLAAQDAGVPMLVNFATLGFKDNAYSRTKQTAERILADAEGLLVTTLRLPAVYSSAPDVPFRGGLALLNPVPKWCRAVVFDLLASLRPTVSISKVMSAVDEALQADTSFERIVSDRQINNKPYHFAKRLIDLMGVSCVVLLAGWLMVLIAIAVRTFDGSPVIFRQTRVGQHQKPFTLYKFRTMRTGTAQAGTHEIGADAITSIGKFLRKTKLDELPQILNVLKGELSFIGPRPGLPMQTELNAERARRSVFSALPGMTGLAQTEGLDMSRPAELAKRDADYLALRSIILDFKILLRTVIKKR